MAEITVLAFIAALISLDITAFGQFMISRPAIVGPLFGYLMGDIKTGLVIGFIIELIWVSFIPMGAAIPTDVTTVAVLSSVWGLKYFSGHHGIIVLAMLLAIPAGMLYKQFDIIVRYFNVSVMRWVEEGVKNGDERRIEYGVHFSLLLFFFKSFVFYFLLIATGKLLVHGMFLKLPGGVMEGFDITWHVLPAFAMAVMLVSFLPGRLAFNRERKENEK
ncbi:MAG TPA: hypothetical protein DEE98_00580 [Elusimicrobia bacterium]|nr:MAG: hypothetical protein A2278_03210 [Elusimicrobia bacterium RIFOXYA12_FULL_49_49]OGS09684.1 MAG: hypothetical protein A2386_01270 [Elusimicrobia bacterium RIFOXYB1_FULL_48_9]OGS15573.1 MAG: hypothetical protein A2251_03460 [Elusimicrobia bacterium RIFOXYA2_FULL_47_53]OGS26871.1 MAG: hypothetical protein A2339_07520 [Elusimicrobia bacterium RIFOXYB12_FULL_50_12]OGS30672.1 MAG: hypothetical protein A2323_07265 [Elusimicrobia bacterium RIFOXYB2_FULL_46_23]HBU68861.1 hypothetical protein [El